MTLNKQSQYTINILLVRDHGLECGSISSHLNKTNLAFVMTEASNIEQAIDAIQNTEIDVVFLDYQLSTETNNQSLKNINSLTESGCFNIIMLADDDDQDAVFECLSSGAQDVLFNSNISPMELKRALYSALNKSTLQTDLNQSNSDLKQLKEHDWLTGLLNRQYFNSQLTEHFKNDQDRNFILILLDINNFKTINDLYGHQAGDELLKKFATIVKSTLPDKVLFARLSGNEFAVFLDSRIYNAHLACQAIYKSLEDYVTLGDLYQKISISIGYALSPKDANDTTKLYQCADLALYYSKANSNQVPFGYSSSMQKASNERTEMKSIINQAFKDDNFSIQYQPILSSFDDSLLGFEALMRLTHDDKFISPDRFIKVLEDMKLFHEIGYWLIEEVLKQQSKWLKKSTKDLRVSINLSPVQLNDEKIIAFIFETIKKYKIKPALVLFELTETVLLDSPSRVKLILNRISGHGCKIALDDFGTGFSSLSHLKEFPIDTVKIDKSMIPLSENDTKAIDIMTGLVMMLNSLRLDIVAEGIETNFQLAFCKKLEIPKIQGYIYDKPLTPNAIDKKHFSWKKIISNKLNLSNH